MRSCSSEMSETHNIRDRVAFSDCEIVGHSRPYEKRVQCGPNSWLMETGAICTPFVAGEPRPSCFSAISRTSSVALFHGSDSSNKNVAFSVDSRRERKIIASEALNSDSSFRSPQFKPYSGASDLQQTQVVDFDFGSENSPAKGSSGSSSPDLFCANPSSEGERCMKDTDHPIRHPSVHPRLSGRVRSQRSCAGCDDQFGRGQNTGLGWRAPLLCTFPCPK